MSQLSLLASTQSILTRTELVADPADPTKAISVSYPCDLDGDRLAVGDQPVIVYRDLISGKSYARVAEVIPSGADQLSRQQAAVLNALKPIHYTDPDGTIRGYFVVAPDFNKRETVPAVPATVLSVESEHVTTA